MRSSREKRSASGSTDQPSKIARNSAPVAESGGSEKVTWREVALTSEALRKQMSLEPTGQLDPQVEEAYLQYLPLQLSRVLNDLRFGTYDAQHNWPAKDDRRWTTEDTKKAVCFGVALADADISLKKLQLGTEEFQRAKAIANQHFLSRHERPSESLEQNPELARVAFERSEMPDGQGSYPSRRLREKLLQYATEYYDGKNTNFHSPYTSIVGPSGSGKTFSVKHLADDEDVWVLYTSLSRTSLSVPARGSLGSIVEAMYDSEKRAETTWNRYILVGRLLVAVAKDRGLSPGMLFRMQYHQDFDSFRRDIAEAVGDFSVTLSRRTVSKIVDDVDVNSLRDWEKKRSKRPSDPDRDVAADNLLVVCMDEARALLHMPADGPESAIANAAQPIALRTLRRALRPNEEKGSQRLFGLLLDTSSRVQNFSPSAASDPSLKIARRTDLFPPLYGIHAVWDRIASQSQAVQEWLRTIIVSDGMTTNVQTGPQDTKEWRRFFYSLGRPLWGAILEASVQRADEEDEKKEENDRDRLGLGFEKIRDLVRAKLSQEHWKTKAEKEYYFLALLLFRLQFYVSDPKLSEACVADWMHYVRTISADRATIQTVQPGEPVLAQHVTERMRESPAFREELVGCFVRSLHYGTLNVGDSGEIVAGLLLLLAVDSMPHETENEVGLLHRSLTGFLCTFAGWTKLPKRAAQARIHVTHLGRLCIPSAITQRHLCVAFLTGEAWLMSTNFAGVDLLVPVWQGPGKPMTALLIQVKNRHGPREITPALVNEARTSLGAGRARIAALRDDALPVYGLFLNLRPLAESAGAPEPTRTSELSEGSLTAYVRTGFSRETLGFLTPRLYAMLHGVVSAHCTGIVGEDQHGLRAMLQTRDGSTFWENACAEDRMDL